MQHPSHRPFSGMIDDCGLINTNLALKAYNYYRLPGQLT